MHSSNNTHSVASTSVAHHVMNYRAALGAAACSGRYSFACLRRQDWVGAIEHTQDEAKHEWAAFQAISAAFVAGQNFNTLPVGVAA